MDFRYTRPFFTSQEEMNKWIEKQQRAACNQMVTLVEVNGVWKKLKALPEKK